LKDNAYSTFLGQKPPFELRRKLAFRLQSFHEIHRGSSNRTNPSISVGGGQQDWLAFALRRQRSHVRIVSGAPTTLMRDLVTAPACLTDEKSGRLNPAHYLLRNWKLVNAVMTKGACNPDTCFAGQKD
jgi:hypothetical protein